MLFINKLDNVFIESLFLWSDFVSNVRLKISHEVGTVKRLNKGLAVYHLENICDIQPNFFVGGSSQGHYWNISVIVLEKPQLLTVSK
jgi:hypothetical protein